MRLTRRDRRRTPVVATRSEAPAVARGRPDSHRLRVLVTAIALSAAACGDVVPTPADPAPPRDARAAPGHGLLRVVRAIECCYAEGSYAGLRITGPGGRVAVDRESLPRASAAELASVSLPPGAWRVETWERPCAGNCGRKDPPTDRCSTTVRLAAGEGVDVRVRVLPGAGCVVDVPGGPVASEEPPVAGTSWWPTTLVRVDGRTGTVRDETPVRDAWPQLVGAVDGQAFILAGPGERRRLRPGPERDLVSAELVDDVVVAVSAGGRIIALDAAGRERWSRAGDGSRPSVGGGMVFVHESEDELIALDARDGRIRWRVAARAVVAATHAGEVFLDDLSADTSWRVLDVATGRERRRVLPPAGSSPDGWWSVGTSLVGVAVQDDAPVLVRWDPATGATRWRTPLASWPSSTTVVGDAVIVATHTGVGAFAADTGRRRWRLAAPWRVGSRLTGPVADGPDVLFLRR